jgi:hypothetical protein
LGAKLYGYFAGERGLRACEYSDRGFLNQVEVAIAPIFNYYGIGKRPEGDPDKLGNRARHARHRPNARGSAGPEHLADQGRGERIVRDRRKGSQEVLVRRDIVLQLKAAA